MELLAAANPGALDSVLEAASARSNADQQTLDREFRTMMGFYGGFLEAVERTGDTVLIGERQRPTPAVTRRTRRVFTALFMRGDDRPYRAADARELATSVTPLWDQALQLAEEAAEPGRSALLELAKRLQTLIRPLFMADVYDLDFWISY